MKRYARAIFDFDGTLADSFAFFLSVHNELARSHGFRAVSPDEVPALRRLGAREIMREVGLPARKLPAVAKDFVLRMRANRSSIATFPGASELLVDLARAGIALAIVSSNSRENVTSILGAQASAAIERYSCGVSIFGKRARLRKVLAASGAAAGRALYIGDQSTDLEAAHAEGIAFGAVGWGYGDLGHLQRLGAEHSFGGMDDIRKLLLPG